MKLDKKIAISMIVTALLTISTSSPVAAEVVNDLQASIKEKLQKIEELKKKASDYEAGLKQKRQERLSLSNQLTILTDRINKTILDVEVARTSIEATNLEINLLENNIKSKEKQIADYKEQLGVLMRWL